MLAKFKFYCRWYLHQMYVFYVTCINQNHVFSHVIQQIHFILCCSLRYIFTWAYLYDNFQNIRIVKNYCSFKPFHSSSKPKWKSPLWTLISFYNTFGVYEYSIRERQYSNQRAQGLINFPIAFQNSHTFNIVYVWALAAWHDCRLTDELLEK